MIRLQTKPANLYPIHRPAAGTALLKPGFQALDASNKPPSTLHCQTDILPPNR